MLPSKNEKTAIAIFDWEREHGRFRGSTRAGGAAREQGEQEGAGGAAREHEGAQREHFDERGVSARAKQRYLSQQEVTCWPGFRVTLYIFYTYPFDSHKVGHL